MTTPKRYDCYYNDDFGADHRAFEKESEDGDYYRVEDVVLAVNSHDALVEALQRLIDDANEVIGHTEDGTPVAQYDDGVRFAELNASVMNAMVALAAAKGGE